MITHSLTLRQIAKRLGVSLAAVRAWQAQGLLHQVQCPFCSSVSVPADAVDRMAGAIPPVPEAERGAAGPKVVGEVDLTPGCTTTTNEDDAGARTPDVVSIA